MTAKKCTKKRDARAKLLFCQSKPIAFLPFLLTSPSSLLKLPSNPNATRDYFGGKSHSHPRLVKQRQLKLNKDEKGKVEIVSVSVLSKVLSLD